MTTPGMDLATTARAVVDSVERVIDGKRAVVETAVTVLLAEGHLLVEDVPGVGKTVLARALARSVGATSRRIQFTADLLPSDITGVSMFAPGSGTLEFTPGPVFAHLVVADEINRASPKTQSALLESMEERRVTVDGTTRDLPRPFTVIATQNPQDMEGTHPLPEAQRDRFTARVTLGYPDRDAELTMVSDRDRTDPIDHLRPVVTIEQWASAIAAVRTVAIAPAVEAYIVDILRATRTDERVRLGASPRAGLQLVRAAKARAVLQGRGYVLPDDVDALAVVVLAHRLGVVRGGPAAADLVREFVARVPVPTPVA